VLWRLSVYVERRFERNSPWDCLPISYCVFLLTFVDVCEEHPTDTLQWHTDTCVGVPPLSRTRCDLVEAAERATRGARESKCELNKRIHKTAKLRF
jgi:hypothetical protein